MVTISLCMIVRNEEKTLPRCLATIKDVVDEIIIVDTGSIDQTKAVALGYTKWVYDFEWVYDFSKARNFSFSKATKDYILWLDADDVLLKEDAVKLMQLKSQLEPAIEVVYMKYHLMAAGEEKPIAVFWRERLVKREQAYLWYEPVHEYLLCPGKTIKVDIAITHHQVHPPTTRNLEIFERYIASGQKLSDRNLFYYGRELFLHGQMEKAATYFEAYLKTTEGIMVTYMEACVKLSKYYHMKGEEEKCLAALLQYFEKDGPRAEICCELGYYYKKHEQYDRAISWFAIASHTIKPLDSIGAIQLSCWDYIPYMELCACYYRKGQLGQAIYYNEKAASIRPLDEKILYNRRFLKDEQLRTGK